MKPDVIIRKRYDLAELMSQEQWVMVLEREKRRMETVFHKLGLTLRQAVHEDIHGINQRTHTSFSKEAADGISLYDVYRLVHHGYPVVALDRNRAVLAYDLSVSYDDGEKISYEVALAVDQSLSGHGLGGLLSTYGAILALERGSRIRKATVHPLNFPSVKSLLNHVGFSCTGFDANFLGTMGPRLILKMPLSPRGLVNRSVSTDALLTFVQTHKEGSHYRVIPCDAFDEMDRIYRETRFRIGAFVPEKILGPKALFLAFPFKTDDCLIRTS